jgi:hypothetical protein
MMLMIISAKFQEFLHIKASDKEKIKSKVKFKNLQGEILKSNIKLKFFVNSFSP